MKRPKSETRIDEHRPVFRPSGFASSFLNCAQIGFSFSVFPSQFSRISRIPRFEIFVFFAFSAVTPIWFWPPRLGCPVRPLILHLRLTRVGFMLIGKHNLTARSRRC